MTRLRYLNLHRDYNTFKDYFGYFIYPTLEEAKQGGCNVPNYIKTILLETAPDKNPLKEGY